MATKPYTRIDTWTTETFKLVDVDNGRSANYSSMSEAIGALARMGVKYPAHDFRIFRVEETHTLVHTTEKGIEPQPTSNIAAGEERDDAVDVVLSDKRATIKGGQR